VVRTLAVSGAAEAQGVVPGAQSAPSLATSSAPAASAQELKDAPPSKGQEPGLLEPGGAAGA
jgi:hypothetical protein